MKSQQSPGLLSRIKNVFSPDPRMSVHPGDRLEGRRELSFPVARKRPPDEDLSEIPISGLGNWTVPTISAACIAHCNGQFSQSSILAESMVADDRIQSSLNGRTKGITSRANQQEASPADLQLYGGAVAAEVRELWSDVITEEAVEHMVQWQVLSGFALFRIDWAMQGGRWVPSLYPWNLRYCYFDWSTRCYVAITAEGVVQIDPVRDPRWLLLTPFGYNRGYIRAAVRSLAAPWFVRSLALRDWARFCEKHGLPITLIQVPAQGDSGAKQRLEAAMRNLGAESTLLLPRQSGDDGEAWDAKLLEAKDTSWKAFPGIIDQCDQSITLVIRGTNLTTQVRGASLAASKTHREEDSEFADADCRKLCGAVRDRLWWWYCLYNFGRPDLAPKSTLARPDDQQAKEFGDGLTAVCAGLAAAKDLGFDPDVEKVLRKYGLTKAVDADGALPAPSLGEGEDDEDVTGGDSVLDEDQEAAE